MSVAIYLKNNALIKKKPKKKNEIRKQRDEFHCENSKFIFKNRAKILTNELIRVSKRILKLKIFFFKLTGQIWIFKFDSTDDGGEKVLFGFFFA